ncbi:flagellar basal body rod C-terminal domain-containing protein, partial [Sphingomonas sp. Ant20]|uniref:flagellar basal body rod C-terminal domain-containing protein n=1 Tax=Sphingomonas sp. Ant20 TaxID=104605 RepID=UPI0012FF1899
PPPAAQRRLPPGTAHAAVTTIAGADIIVAASKRDTRLRDFAGQVAHLDGIDLALGGAGGSDAVLARLASVSSTHLGAGRNKLFIRGIADSSFTGPTQTTVGQYLGDIRLSYNAPDPDLRLYDIASVEVLEGPQGTLYGAGSLGGIIRTVPNAPVIDDTTAAIATGVSATTHGDPGGDIGATLNLPVMEGRMALRIVGYAVTEGGYIDNPTLGQSDVNRTSIAGGRGTLRVDLGRNWTLDLGGVYQRTRGDDSQYTDRDAPPRTRNSAVVQGFGADYRMGDLVVSGTLGGLMLRSSTAIVGQTLTERYDATMVNGDPRLFVQRNATAMLTNETRLWRPMRAGFGWVVGGSFTHNRTRLSRALGAVEAPVPVTGVTNRIDEATLYGEASVALFPGLIATGGARDASNLAALLATRDPTTGSEQRLTNMITSNAASLEQRKLVGDAQGAIRDGAVTARDSGSGVDLDSEAVDLLRFQQAYQASSRVIQTARDILQTILEIR